jgi:hypothetical protein
MTIHMGLTKATLAMSDATLPTTEVAASSAISKLFLQSGFDKLVLI